MKKSQLTQFIILGLLMLIMFGAALFASREKLGFGTTRQEKVEFTPELLTLTMDNCINELVLKSMARFGVCDKVKEFTDELKYNLSDCLNIEQYEPFYNVEAADQPDVLKVDMNEERVRVELLYPIKLSNSEKVIQFESREVTVPLHKSILLELDSTQRTVKDYVLVSYDDKLELNIPKGTRVTSGGMPISEVGVKAKELCPRNPELLGELNMFLILSHLSLSRMPS